jgi:hypothetical protein
VKMSIKKPLVNKFSGPVYVENLMDFEIINLFF